MNNMPTPYWPAAGSLKPSLRRGLRQKFVRHLHEDARAVAGVRLAAARAAMVEVHENLQRVGEGVHINIIVLLHAGAQPAADRE